MKTTSIEMSEETIIVQIEKIPLVAKALSTKSRLMMLKILLENNMDITQLTEKLGMSLAGISQNIKILEEAGLIEINYKPGGHGVRKICSTKIKRVLFDLV